MKQITSILLSSILCLFSVSVNAAGNVHLEAANTDLNDKNSLQRGAKYFANYCISCHSLKYSRYNRVGKDLGISDELMSANLIFTTDEDRKPTKVGDLMLHSMNQRDAEAWFGTLPPDLSLVARSKGADWIYTYLHSFYKDPKKTFGVNNTIFPNVGMPHILWELQGMQEQKKNENGETKLVLAQAGTKSPQEYDQIVRDITNFLVYVGEPIQLKRIQYGIFTLIFLFVFFILAYLLKKEYWKDVH